MAATTTIPTRTQAEMLSLVEETVAYYGKNPKGRRATGPSETSCLYQTTDGRKCAVGRCLVNPSLIQTAYGTQSINNLENAHRERKDPNPLYKPEYEGYPTSLWMRLQSLHDRSYHWSSKGLSGEGKAYVKEIKAWIIANYPPVAQ